MTVDRLYVDSSVLRWLYVHGAKSSAVARWRHRMSPAMPVTRFGRVELTNAIAAAAFRGELDADGRDRAWQALAEDLGSGALVLTDIPWRAVLDRAADLGRQYTPVLGVRSLDILHVASALELDARQMATYDDRQGRLGQACGLKVIQP
jgi:hypothetical protein